MIVNAILLALSISLSLAMVNNLLYKLTDDWLISCLGELFFLIAAFIIFKTTSPSTYLYWQYNQCTTYYYSIPSYLCFAFSIYLLGNHVTGKSIDLSFNTAICLAILYFLIFSFLPGALLIAVTAFCILVEQFIKIKNIRRLLLHCWFHIIALVLFVVKLYMEFHRVFDNGYFTAPTQIKERLKRSFLFMISTFFRMNKLFLIVSVAMILLATGIFLYNKKNSIFIVENYAWLKTLILSICSILLIGVFFILFGVIDLGHLVRDNGLPVRTDSMYVFYALFILIITLNLTIILKTCKSAIVVTPLIMLMMSTVVLSTRNEYSDSIYMDSTPYQKYRIMKSVTDEARDRSKEGVYSLVAHVPKYNHYGSQQIGYALYWHNITDRVFSIEFKYDEGLDKVYFE